MPVERRPVYWDELFEHEGASHPQIVETPPPPPPPETPIYVTDPRQPHVRRRLGGRAPMDMTNPFVDFF